MSFTKEKYCDKLNQLYNSKYITAPNLGTNSKITIAKQDDQLSAVKGVINAKNFDLKYFIEDIRTIFSDDVIDKKRMEIEQYFNQYLENKQTAKYNESKPYGILIQTDSNNKVNNIGFVNNKFTDNNTFFPFYTFLNSPTTNERVESCT